MVSVQANTNRLVLGQRQVDGKSNEITAIPELLNSLMLDGCIVAADTLNCQMETAKAILDQRADYLLTLKGNHPLLHDDVVELFDTPADDVQKGAHYVFPHDQAKTVDKGHGRIEIRQARTIDDPALIAGGLSTTNFATLRHIALNLPKQDKSLRAGWDHHYLITVLQPLLASI